MLTIIEDMKRQKEDKKALRNSIYRAKGQTEKQTKNLKELFKLIQKHPDLPIVAMVDSEVVADDGYGYWMGSWGSCLVDKYIIHKDYGVIFYDEGQPDIVDIFEKYFDYVVCGIDEEMPDKEALPLMRKRIDTLEWIEAIIVYIQLPDTENIKEG